MHGVSRFPILKRFAGDMAKNFAGNATSWVVRLRIRLCFTVLRSLCGGDSSFGTLYRMGSVRGFPDNVRADFWDSSSRRFEFR